MIAYKGFQKYLKCRGFQFQEYGINETEKANCRQNRFHCAENPLDCLCYYPNWKNSVYYIVDASGDLDEDGEDSKISCTNMRLFIIWQKTLWIIKHRFIVKIPETLEKHWELTGSA